MHGSQRRRWFYPDDARAAANPRWVCASRLERGVQTGNREDDLEHPGEQRPGGACNMAT